MLKPSSQEYFVIQSCYHILHERCLDLQKASVSAKFTKIRSNEFQCPFCKQLSNIFISYQDLSRDDCSSLKSATLDSSNFSGDLKQQLKQDEQQRTGSKKRNYKCLEEQVFKTSQQATEDGDLLSQIVQKASCELNSN